MFGHLRITPTEYYKMSYPDMITMLEGYEDFMQGEYNKLRHLIAAPSWAMGSKIKVKQIMPLSIDDHIEENETITKEEFLQIQKLYKIRAKA